MYINILFFVLYLLSLAYTIHTSGNHSHPQIEFAWQQQSQILSQSISNLSHWQLPKGQQLFPDLFLFSLSQSFFEPTLARHFYNICLQLCLIFSLYTLAKVSKHSKPFLFAITIPTCTSILSQSNHEILYVFSQFSIKYAGILINTFLFLASTIYFIRKKQVKNSYVYSLCILVLATASSGSSFFLGAFIPAIYFLAKTKAKYKQEKFIQPIVLFCLVAIIGYKVHAENSQEDFGLYLSLHSLITFCKELYLFIQEYTTIASLFAFILAVNIYTIRQSRKMKYEYLVLFYTSCGQILLTFLLVLLFGYNGKGFPIESSSLPLLSLPLVLGFLLVEFRFKQQELLKNYFYFMMIAILFITNQEGTQRSPHSLEIYGQSPAKEKLPKTVLHIK
ncbi:MAG: hypothetical protein AAF518_19040 [Spirochaetota bacterium]